MPTKILPDIILIMCDIFKGGVNSLYLRPLLYLKINSPRLPNLHSSFSYVSTWEIGLAIENIVHAVQHYYICVLNVRVMNSF